LPFRDRTAGVSLCLRDDPFGTRGLAALVHWAVFVCAARHPSLGRGRPAGADRSVTGEQHQTQSDGCKAEKHSHSVQSQDGRRYVAVSNAPVDPEATLPASEGLAWVQTVEPSARCTEPQTRHARPRRPRCATTGCCPSRSLKRFANDGSSEIVQHALTAAKVLNSTHLGAAIS
jgi:hypothetical protein